jgi:streptogramin lyase
MVALCVSMLALSFPLLGGTAGAIQQNPNPLVVTLGYFGYANNIVSDNAGDVFVANYSAGEIYEISPSGSVSNFAAVPHVWGLTSDASGNLYAADYSDGIIYKITPSGVMTSIDSGGAFESIYGLAVDASGNVYFSDCGGTINEVTPAGVETTFATNAGGCGLVIDTSGALFSTDGTSTLYEITPAGVVITLSTNLTTPYGLTISSAGNLYTVNYDTGEIDEITPAGVVSTALPAGSFPDDQFNALGLSSTGNLYVESWDDYGVFELSGFLSQNATPAPTPTNLSANESAGTLSASWTESSAATGYTCTLLYGFNDPSGFTVSTASTSCSFSGLDPAVAYGVSVVANGGGASSSPALSFAQVSPPSVTTTTSTTIISRPALKITIICVKGHVTKHVRGVHPHCPSGYHRKG